MEEKKIQIMDLLSYAIGIPEMKYFNLDSDELLDTWMIWLFSVAVKRNYTNSKES